MSWFRVVEGLVEVAMVGRWGVLHSCRAGGSGCFHVGRREEVVVASTHATVGRQSLVDSSKGSALAVTRNEGGWIPNSTLSPVI